MLFYIGQGSVGGLCGTNFNGYWTSPAIGSMDDLTTTYKRGFFSYEVDSKMYLAKKSSDGLTVYWYIDSYAGKQFNDSNNRYRYIVFG